jgi:prolyl oligopeptidase
VTRTIPSFCSLALATLALGCGPADITMPPPPAPPAPTAKPAEGPPVTAKKPVVNEYHGVRVTDDYQWLEQGDDKEVKAWSDAENAWARRHLDAPPGRDALRARARSLLVASASTHDLKESGGVYFALQHQPPLQQDYLIVLSSLDDAKTARTLVDPNKLDPKGRTTIDFYVPSHDGKRVAVSLSEGGTENGTLHVYDVATGKELGDRIAHVNGGTAGGSVAWNGDGSGLWYTRYPRPGERSKEDLDFYQQVYFHKLGTPEPSDRYEIGKDFPRIAEVELESSDDGKLVLALVQNGDGGQFELHLRGASGKWEKVARYEDGIKAARFGHDASVFLRSVSGAPKGKILKLRRGAHALGSARVVVPEGEAVIRDFLPTRGRLYVSDLWGGPSDLRSFDLDGKGETKVPILPVSSVRELVRGGGSDLVFRNVSYTEPPAFYRFSPRAKEAQKTALFSTSPATYGDAEVVRDTCVSRDGTKVPISILRKKGIALDQSHPTLLNGYGGYGVNRMPRFNPIDRVWLDHGGVYVFANLRGGGEFGEAWHEAGALTHKQNVFDDFAACARKLVEAGYTRPERLAIMGGSNGGLLMGATFTQHPELVRAVVSAVGIYDMLRVERTPNGAFNVTEFGTVKDKAQFDALYAYSPYHHVKDGAAYPSILFLTGANDPRVDPFHSRKMTARLQASGTKRPVLLRTSSDTGHGMGTPLDAEIEEDVDIYSFLFHELGMR